MNDEINNNEPMVNPDSPSVVPTPGWKTSQGQMTAIFTLVCLILSLFGYSLTPERIESWIDAANSFVGTILPLIVSAWTLVTYIISRGKIASNTINANAAIKQAVATGQSTQIGGGTSTVLPAMQTVPTPPMIAPLMDDRFTRIIGGTDWKDPERYGKILKIAAAAGVPGATQANEVNEKFDVDTILDRILDAAKGQKDKK